MADSLQISGLRGATKALAAHGVVPKIAATLEQDRGDFAVELVRAVVDQVPAFSESGNPDALPQLEAHLDAQVKELIRLLGAGLPGDFAFVRDYAQHVAGHRFPLEAVLHTYRSAHKLISAWIRDAALETADSSAQVRRVVAAAADFTLEYMDVVSTIATSSYVEHTRVLAEAEGDRRTELLNLLLSGYDEADARAAQLLRRAGYLAQRQSYCIVAARSVDPREMLSAARAQRMADAVADALHGAPLRVLTGIRDGLVLSVVSSTRRLSGWTAPQSLLADQVFPLLRRIGPAALIGLSNDVPSTAHIPRAATEAKLALEFATVGDRVMRYASIPLRKMLVVHARDQVHGALPVWLETLVAADNKARGALAETLRAYADADMNVQQAAKVLGVHPNTIYTRARRIADITGKDLLAYHDLTEMLLALDCRE